MNPRPPAVYHCTSEPLRFFGRDAELATLTKALNDTAISVVGLIGLGGQGKTAIVHHWLQPFAAATDRLDGLFFWSFYRGKDTDLCLREILAYAERSDQTPEVAASYCVDHLLPRLRRERWIIVLDGAEVVQHEAGAWMGRFLHPELGRLVEELASEPMPGVLVITTRFSLPTLEKRSHVRLIDLATMDAASARFLIGSAGVCGSEEELDQATAAMGRHAKGVELLGTWLAHFADGDARRHGELPPVEDSGLGAEERSVARVLAAFCATLPTATRDIVALATAFRQPPDECRLLDYLSSRPVQAMLSQTWRRDYEPFDEREAGWLERQLQWLVDLRLLERVGAQGHQVIDAHPLVRRGFEGFLGPEGQRQGAGTRAGYLRGRPDRRPPESLDHTREEVELFHAYCDAGLWNEADGTFVHFDNPKHRFLAPAFERDLLLRFFPDGNWRKPPLWPGFGRWRSLAIGLEMLGKFADALEVYRPADEGLRGDALIALGRLEPLVGQESVGQPWQNLWRAYRAHALILAGRKEEAIRLARLLVPIDTYEMVHVFECLLRAGSLSEWDPRRLSSGTSSAQESSWRGLVERRLAADWRRLCGPSANLEKEYAVLVEAFDRGGLPWERALVRLGQARWLLVHDRRAEARAVTAVTITLAERYHMPIVAADAFESVGDMEQAVAWRAQSGYLGPGRP
jgi:hypothetical protein